MNGTRNNRHAFTRLELLTSVVAAAAIIAVMLPMVGAGRSRSRELASLANLKTLGIAHAAYAVDWNGRQFTNMNDNMGQSGGLYSNYLPKFGCPASIVLGFGSSFPNGGAGGLWGFWMPCESSNGLAGNFPVLWPMAMGTTGGGSSGFGMWRLQNIVGFNEYVNGRFMDPLFYAPADDEAMAVVGPGFESPDPFTLITYHPDEFALSSYAASPAAMFHPGVFGGDADGVYKSPYTFADSSLSPTVDQCLHPDLKTRLIEHGWLQAPAMANLPSPTLFKPYFNHGADSVPMTLFFDGHVSALPVRKVLSDNAAVVKGGGAKLWMDTEITDGNWAQYEGYYSAFSFDDTRTSFHVFTRGGILGRDVITPTE